MGINKSFGILLIALLIVLLLILQCSYAKDIIYKGFYKIQQWPIISVEYVNNSSVIMGIIIIINSANTTATGGSIPFTGLEIIGPDYYLVNGFLYSNQTIIVIVIKQLNLTNINITNTGNTIGNAINISNEENIEKLVRGKLPTVKLISINPSLNKKVINPISTINTVNTVSSLNTHNQGNHSMINNNANNKVKPSFLSLWTITLINLSLFTVSLLIPLVLMINPLSDRECVENVFSKFIKRLGINDPSTTPRNVGELIAGMVSADIVNKVINIYEEAVYGNKSIKCMEFKQLIKELNREIKHAGRHRRGR